MFCFDLFLCDWKLVVQIFSHNLGYFFSISQFASQKKEKGRRGGKGQVHKNEQDKIHKPVHEF